MNISYDKSRTTPDNITELQPNEVFVFGSNERGIHGAGAAAYALKEFGAVLGEGEGHYGRSYALPTKNAYFKTLSYDEIGFYVANFLRYAEENPNLTFYVTQVGCGLAGCDPKKIAKMFSVVSRNVILPLVFLEVQDVTYEPKNGTNQK